MNNINLNVEDYSDNELLEIADLSEDLTYNEVESEFTKKIKNFLKNKDYNMAQFFHNAKNKILSNMLDDNNKKSTSQAEEWLQNQYRKPVDNLQGDKITDRRNNIDIFGDNAQQIMSQKLLGVSNTLPLNVAQDTLNPTLRQTVTRHININSRQRYNSIPFFNNPQSKNSSTNFTVNLTEPLNNVLSIKVESYNIPTSLNTIDSWYGNDNMVVLSSNDSTFTDISSCNKVVIKSGTYTNAINLINRVNLDISNCISDELKDISGNLLLQLHLENPIAISSKSMFVNSSNKYVKIIFFERVIDTTNSKNYFTNSMDCSQCVQTETKCNKNSIYDNNLGYYLGYRIERIIDTNGNQIIENTNSTGNQLTIILEPADNQNENSVTTELININNNLQYLDISYTMTQYARDIENLINLGDSLGKNIYNISNVPLSLISTKYLYICVNDFLQNRSPENVITISPEDNKIFPLPSYASKKTNVASSGIPYEDQLNDIELDIICSTNPTESGVGNKYYVPSFPRKLTQNQIFVLNEVISNISENPIRDNTFTITDILAIIPFDNKERTIVENINFKERKYFGPVRLKRLEIQLKDERGNLVNLNGQDWTFNLVIEQLYQY